ncbi:hypothetical protein O7635_20825 [Asanoa sp. WMMD1127]|uniref:hypothetical protein n=1 Tax=Asanoa sp. WMMD1127 TaxID=3016107 RepID=UPI002417665B|nr:hypothetical protein [Asanoa sp. WMMD1127]MDG4824303.1 hypothetical protein [Asanoa sp. WMMD1127]
MSRFPAAFGVVALVAAVALSACGDDNAPAAQAPAGDSTTPNAAPATTVAAEPMDARGVIDSLAAAGLPLTSIVEQDENTDPNGKLGRPGGYTSRASADVPEGRKDGEKYGIDRGLVVEVFATPEDAATRSKFIQDALKAAQILGTEYHYQPADKRVLVRLTGAVKPSRAKVYEVAVTSL